MFPVLKNDLIIRAAQGKPVEKVPVWVMRQAGRYDPEFLALRKKHTFFEICQTPELSCAATLQPIARYGPLLDSAIIFSDILVIPQALGMTVEMLDKGGPFFPTTLSQPSDLKTLRTSEESLSHLNYVYEAITLTRHALQGNMPLIGFCGSPWTLMAYMTEGHGTKMFSKCKTWLFNYPQESHRLLQLITDVCVGFLVGQVKAGAQLLQIFDSWGGELSPTHFAEFSAPYLSQIARHVKKALGNASVPMIVFAKGVHWGLDVLNAMEYDVVQLDMTVDPVQARKLLQGKTLQGNMDPGCLYGSKQFIEKQVEDMFKAFGTERWIANLGHGMHPDHDVEHLKWFLEAIRDCSVKYCPK